MFLPKSEHLTIDGTELLITEMKASTAREIQKIGDEWAATCRAFVIMVRKPDGTPFFGSEAEVDELPTSVVQKLGEAIKALNEPKN